MTTIKSNEYLKSFDRTVKQSLITIKINNLGGNNNGND